jgi:signal transduction histidine kinase
MRVLPRSLFGRLTLVLLLGLVAAQLLSAWFLLRDRGQALYQSMRENTVARVAGIVRLLDALRPAERDRLLPLLSAPETLVELAAAPVPAPVADAASVSALVAEGLRRHLPPGMPVRVAVSGTLLRDAMGADPDAMGMDRRMAQMRAHMMGGGPMAGPWGYLHGVHAMARAFFIQVQLHDGTWVRFARQIPEELFDRPTRLLVTLLMLLVSVVLLSLFAVRRLIGPLAELRVAADALGKDIDRPPLPESGPLEVAQTAHAFNTMQARLKSYIGDRARILAAVSHDLKTPLTRLRLRTDLLDDEALRDKIQEDLATMETMVGATLDFMRGTESREASQTLDLMALLEGVRDDAEEAGWEVALTGALNAPVPGRPLALQRAVTNLVENAVRYGERAEIHVNDEGHQVRIRVLDAGPGIPEAMLGQVFDPFFRLESSRARHTGGTGLGLGIARNIARAHGGDLRLANRPEGGLCAALVLPR